MGASLYNLPIVAALLRRTDLKANNAGIIAMMKIIAKRSQSNFKVKYLDESLSQTLTIERVLVVSNHPAVADVPLLLAALKEREDVYLIASHQFLNILPSIDKNIIPVYINNRMMESHGWMVKFFNKIHQAEELTSEQAHYKNIKSIQTAAHKINNGGEVVIFPAAKEKDYQFMSGVGHLIKGLKHPKETRVVMAYIEGTSNWDFLRLIPYAGRLLPKLQVTFSKPYEAADFCDQCGKTTAKRVEKEYYRWTKKIGNRTMPKDLE